jgi:NADP-dependent 3-hydroxy acid dehydrogenase YdfG
VKLNISLFVFQLAKLGIDIILISRTKTKLEAVAAEIGKNRMKYVEAHVAPFNRTVLLVCLQVVVTRHGLGLICK